MILDGRVGAMLADKSKWTEGVSARDASNKPMHTLVTPSNLALTIQQIVNDPRACSWCLVGAIYKCYGEDGEAVRAKVGKYSVQRFYRSPASLNDIDGYDVVMKLCAEMNL